MYYKEEIIFKFLSIKSKKDIIIHLFMCQCSDCSVSSLCKFTNNKQANVSKHLIDLKNENIVVSERKGKNIRYKLNDSFINEYEKILNWIIKRNNFICKCDC